MDLKCLQVEDMISRYESYIVKNMDRLPNFRSLKEAKEELVLSRKKMKDKSKCLNAKEIDERINCIEGKQMMLREEEKRVFQIRKMSLDSRNLEKSELENALKRLDETKRQWKLCQKLKMEAEEEEKRFEEYKTLLNNKKLVLQRLKKDGLNLKQQEKQSIEEINSLKNAKKEMEKEEKEILKMKNQIKEKNQELISIKNKINEKLKIADEKKKNISFLLSKSEKIEDYVSSIINDTEPFDSKEVKEIEDTIRNANKPIDFDVVDPSKTMNKIELIIRNLT